MYSFSEERYFRVKNIASMVAVGEGIRLILCCLPIKLLKFGQLFGIVQYLFFTTLYLIGGGRSEEMSNGSGYRVEDYLVYLLIHAATLIAYIPLACIPGLMFRKKADDEHYELTKYRVSYQPAEDEENLPYGRFSY